MITLILIKSLHMPGIQLHQNTHRLSNMSLLTVIHHSHLPRSCSHIAPCQRSFGLNHCLIFYKCTPTRIPKMRFAHFFSSSRSQPVLDDSSGKSGAKFYQSYDKLFIIKTLTSEEVERMHSFLKHYHPVSTIGSE